MMIRRERRTVVALIEMNACALKVTAGNSPSNPESSMQTDSIEQSAAVSTPLGCIVIAIDIGNLTDC